jgi:hypothetical protein
MTSIQLSWRVKTYLIPELPFLGDLWETVHRHKGQSRCVSCVRQWLKNKNTCWQLFCFLYTFLTSWPQILVLVFFCLVYYLFSSFTCTHLLECGFDLPSHSGLLLVYIQAGNIESWLKVQFLVLSCLGSNPGFAIRLAETVFCALVTSSFSFTYGYITSSP